MKFQDYLDASSEKDLKKNLIEYRNQTQLDLLNSGEYDEELINEIDGQVRQHAADNNVEIDSFSPTQEDDTALVARHSLDTNEPEVATAANRLRALRDPSIRDSYADRPDEYAEKLEAARVEYEAAAPTETREAARRSALNRGDVPFTTFTNPDGTKRLELGHEVLSLAGDDRGLADLFSANPSLDRSLIPDIRRKLKTPEGFTAPLAALERQQDFTTAFDEVAPTLGFQLDGIKSAIAEGRMDNLDPSLEQVDAALAGTPLAEQFSPAERKAFVLDYATRNAPIKLDPENPEKNLRVLSTGEVHVPTPVMMNKAIFDRILPSIPEDQREMAKAHREQTVAAYAKDAFKTIIARRGDEFTNHYAEQKAAGKSDTEILDEYTADPKNQSTAYEYLSGITESIPGALVTAGAAIPALAGNKTAASMIRYFDTQTRQRKEFANIVGKDLGVGYDIATMIAPVVVDILATKGAASIARNTAGAVARAAIKPVVRGFFGATVQEGTKGLVNSFVKGAVKRELGREGLEALPSVAASLKPTQVLNAIGRDIEAGLTRAEYSSAMFATGFNRAAGQSYVGMYSTLEGLKNPDGSRKFNDEQVRDMAVKHATMVGTMTGLTTLGFNAIGLEGTEKIFDGGLTRKQMTGVFTRLKKDWGNMAPAVREGLDMTNADTMVASLMAKSIAPLWKVGVEGAKGEVLEEATQQFLEDIITSHTTGEKFDINASIKGAMYAGMLGGVMGAGATTVADVVSSPKVDAAREDAVRRNALLTTAAKLDANPNLKATAAAVRQLALEGIPQSDPAQEGVPEGVPAAGTESAPSGQGVAGGETSLTPTNDERNTQTDSQGEPAAVPSVSDGAPVPNVDPAVGTDDAGSDAPTPPSPEQVAAYRDARRQEIVAEWGSKRTRSGLKPGTPAEVREELETITNEDTPQQETSPQASEAPELRSLDEPAGSQGPVPALQEASSEVSVPGVEGVESGSETGPQVAAKTAPATPTPETQGTKSQSLDSTADASPRSEPAAVSSSPQVGDPITFTSSVPGTQTPTQGVIAAIDAKGKITAQVGKIKYPNARIVAEPTQTVPRDGTKPEQMTSDEMYADMAKTRLLGGTEGPLAERDKAQTRKDAAEYHWDQIGYAAEALKPVSAEAVDTYGVKLPQGYVRQGELYVYQSGRTKIHNPAAVLAAADIDATPAERLVTDTLTDSDVPEATVAETQGGEAALDEVINAAAPEIVTDGMPLQIKIELVQGGVSERVATLTTAEGDTTQQSIAATRDALSQQGAPTTPDTRFTPTNSPVAKDIAEHGSLSDIKAWLTSVAKTGRSEHRELAKMLLKFPDVLVTPVHLQDAPFAGTFVPQTGQALINTARPGPRGGVDTVLHELVHAATHASILNPTPEQAQVLKRIDGVRRNVQKRAAKAGRTDLAYALGSNDEFFTHLFTSPAFQREVAAMTPKGDRNWVEVLIDAVRDLLGLKTGVLRDMIEFTQSAADLKYGRHAMTTDGRVLMLPAHHGTPHKVDKFSTDFMGTGEGGQAYGWGLYFTESLNVAKSYLSPNGIGNPDTWIYDGGKLDLKNPRHSAAIATGAGAVSVEKAVQNMRSFIEQQSRPAYIAELEQTIKALESGNIAEITHKGSLYNVEILPDESEFLRWEDALGSKARIIIGQTDASQAAIDELEEHINGEYEGMTGREVYVFLKRLASEGELGSEYEGPRVDEAASRFLSDIGFPGITYVGEYTKTGGVGARNFVIFDGNHIQITHENGVPVTPEQATTPAPGPYGTSRMDALMQMPEDVRDTVRFHELTRDIGESPTQADIEAFKTRQPERYAELKAMRERVLRGAGYEVGPFFHGTDSDFDVFEKGGRVGLYFTPDQHLAQAYGQRVMEVLVKITKGAKADAELTTMESTQRGYDQLAEVLKTHDGLIAYPSKGGSREVLLRDPNQIKSTEPLSLDPATQKLIPPDQWGDAGSPSILFQPAEGSQDAEAPPSPEEHLAASHDAGIAALDSPTEAETATLREHHELTTTGNVSARQRAAYRVDPTALERLVTYLKAAVKHLADSLKQSFNMTSAVHLDRLDRELAAAEDGYRIRSGVKPFDVNDGPLMQPTEEDPSSVNYLRAHDGSHILKFKEGEYNPAMAQKGIKAWLKNVFGTGSDLTESMDNARKSDEHLKAATETHIQNLMAGYVKAAKGMSEEQMVQIDGLLNYAVGDTAPMLTPSKEQELNDGLDAKIKAAQELTTLAATAKAIDEANEWAHDTKIQFEIEEAEARIARRDMAQEQLDRIHPEMGAWAKRMRKVLTDTQKELLRRYGKDHPMFAKIDRSLGIYLVRAYEIHRDPNLADKLLHDPAYQETRDAAIDFFEKQLSDNMVEKLQGKTPGWDEMTEAQISKAVEDQRVENYVNHMKRSGNYANVDDAILRATAKLNVANQAQLLFEDLILGNAVTGNRSGVGGDSLKTNVSRFLEKKNIPEELRNALAEIKDPVWNSLHTFTELSNLVHSHRMLGVLTQSGIDSGILVSKEKVDADPKKYHGWKPVAAADSRSRAYAPLAGYYANPENVEAFKAVFRTGSKEAQDTATKSANAATKFMMGMAGTSLAVTTLGNVGFYLRNPIGGVFNLLSQGHNPLATGATTAAKDVARAAFDVQTDADTEARILELTALGIIGNGSQIGYTREILKMSIENPSGAMDKMQEVIGKGSVKLAELFSQGREGTKGFVELLGSIAQVSEEVPMVIAYNANVDMLTRAKFGTPAAIKQEAARRAKLTVFAKSESSQGVKAFSHNPVAAVVVPFARFKTEVFRVLVNTYKLAREDMRSDNPVIKAEGQKRMASALAVHAGLTVGMPLLLAALSGIGGDEDKALRASFPEYDKNTAFWFWRNADGVRSVNLTYLNPYSFSLDPVTGTIRSLMGGNEDQIPGILARTFTDEIFGENIVAGKVIDLKRNVDEATGLPLWLDTDDAATRASKMVLHVASAYNPGVIRTLQKAHESAQRPESSDQPWYYTPEGILLSQFLPTKVRQHNLEDMAYRAYRDQARAQGQHWQITAPMRSPQGFPVDEVEGTYNALRRADSKVQHDTYRISKGYESLGLDARTLRQRMTDAGFSKEKSASILQGFGVKRNLSPDAIEKMNKTDPRLWKRWKELDRQQASRIDLRD